MPAMPLAPDLEHDPRSLPPIFNPSATRTGIGPHNSKAECFTASELSLSRALNSLLPPSLKAAEIRSFKSKPELGQDLRTGTCTGNGDNKLPTLAGDNPKNGNGTGLGGSMTSLQLFNATHLPPRETIRRLATRLTTCLGITFFIVESSAEVESLVDRVYSYCDHYHAARQKPGSDDASSGDFHAVGKGSDSAWTKTTIASERSPQPPTTTEICEILAMAAVGSQYDQQASASLRQACFHSARFGLDDAIEEAEETDAPDDTCYRVLRLLALLAVYQILEKRGSCWRYIGTALNIAKAKGLDQYDLENGSPGEGYLASQHMGMRKIWGTLICLESWIAATLGKPLTTQINLAERIKIGDPIFCCREDSSYPGLDSDEGSLATRSLQTALVRIAILTAAIQRSLYPSARAGGRATDPIGLVQARMHMADLNQWFETLPASLHLSVLLREDAPPLATSAKGRAIAFAERSSMLLGHCLYLSAIMLLTRRIFLSVVNDPDGGYEILHRKGDTTNLPSEKKEALDFVSSCLMAANVMGRIMGLMVSEERLVSKCWMAIYPSFNASLLLLFHLTQRKLLRGDSVVDARFAPGSGHIRDEDDTEAVETTENAKKCLSALEFCAAGGDELSKWYLQVLAPFRKVLGGVSEREIRKRVESIKGDMGQPGFNSVMEEEVTAYPLLPPTGAYNPHDNAMLPSQPGRPPTLIKLTAASPPSKTHNRRSTPSYPDNTRTPANQSATTNASDDPAVLSSHIYNILTVSAQCAFRPEDVSKVVIAGTEYSGSVGHSVPHPSPAPPLGNVRSSHRGSSASSSSDSVSTAASSGTPSSSSRSASSSVEAPSSTLHPNTAYAHSRTRLGRACAQEHEGARITKRASEQQLQSTQPGGAHVYGVGGVKRMKMEAYTALGFGADGKTPSQADLIALLKRAV